jgi:intron-binding protein aquarius
MPHPAGFLRTYVLELDPAQYQLDVNATAAGEAPDVYATFNVLMRRDAKENNFKVCGTASLDAALIILPEE